MSEYIRYGTPMPKEDFLDAARNPRDIDNHLARMATEVDSTEIEDDTAANKRIEQLGRVAFRLRFGSDSVVVGGRESSPVPHLGSVSDPGLSPQPAI
jgi:hypothetical protein